MHQLAQRAKALSRRIDKWTERFCVFLLGLLIIDVWLGVMVRYAIPLPITFTEELARYIMIWTALLAVSCGIARREHIGVMLIFDRFPKPARKWLAVSFDAIAFIFFAFLLVYGIGHVERGFSRVTMIYGVPKAYPFMGVPIAAALACVQLTLVAIHDFYADDVSVGADRAEV